jgi:hypothetical protein
MNKWFCVWWYRYLLESKSWKNLVCRARNHPNDIVWYSHGLEPDTRCKDCGEDLG